MVTTAFAVSDTDAVFGTSFPTPVPFATTLNIPAGGFAMAVGATREGSDFAWIGATETGYFENDVETTGKRSSATYFATTAETGYQISLSPFLVDRITVVAASFTL